MPASAQGKPGRRRTARPLRSPLDRGDDKCSKTVERVEGVGKTVAGERCGYPRPSERRQLFQTVKVGVGVELIVSGAAAFEIREGDVDCGPVPARRIASA